MIRSGPLPFLAVAFSCACGGLPPVASDKPPEPVAGDGGAPEDGWAEVVARAEAMGYRPRGDPETFEAAEGERLSADLSLERDRCYLVAVLGRGVDGLAARLRSSDGLLAVDLMGRRVAWLSHCAEADARARLSVEPSTGRGEVLVGAFEALRREVLDRVGPPLLEQSPPLTAEAAARRADEDLDALGYEPGEPLFDRNVSAGARASASLEVERERCAAVSAVAGGDGPGDLDLEVLRGDGTRVACDRSRGSRAVVRFCAPEDRAYEIVLVSLEGSGRAIVRSHLLPAPAGCPSVAALDLAMAEACAIFARRGLFKVDEPSPSRADAGVWEAVADLEADRCWGVAASAGDLPIERLALVDPDGREIARWERSGGPPRLAACTEDGGERTISVSVEPERDDRPPAIWLFGSDDPSGRGMVTQ